MVKEWGEVRVDKQKEHDWISVQGRTLYQHRKRQRQPGHLHMGPK